MFCFNQSMLMIYPQINNRPINQPVFKGWFSPKSLTGVPSINTTGFFRADMDWKKLVNFIDEKYQGKGKVNIYCYACSNGKEPCTLAMALIHFLGEKRAKDFHIIASDLDPKIMKDAQQGYVPITIYDKNIIDDNLGWNGVCNFFDFPNGFKFNKINGVMTAIGKMRDNLKEMIEFSQKDILQDIDNVNPQNSIVMFRHAIIHLNRDDQIILLNKFKKLGRNSLLIMGHGDFKPANPTSITEDELKQREFTPSPVQYCYEKRA